MKKMNKRKTANKKSPKINTKSGKALKKNFLLYNKMGETRLFLFLAFLLPFVIMWVFFAQNEVHPFGDKQILVTDLWHQYYPFFRVEQEKLQGLSSMLYSWETGMGTNFISLLSYYAGSPLNLLSVFFPLEYSRDALTLILTLKIGCAGLFFAIFLKHTFNKNDFSIVGFGLCFALCNYIMGYYWNIIWIDTVALLPLVVLGTVKLYREGRFKLYAITLALSLISSFYIGLFTCIFTVMVFAALVISEWSGFKNALKRLGQIAGATALGLGLGAVVLIPAYLGLQLTNSVNNQFPENITYYETWLKMISSVIGFHEPTAKEGLPNFYCGMFAIILLGAFIRSRKIKIREKIITVIYLAFIIVSCNMNVLNYMWHGFHFTNMLPYRFSFLLSFILLAAGYRAFTVMKEERNIFDIIALSAMTFVIALVSYRDQTEKALISSMVVCFVFIVAMFIYERKLINEKALNFVVFVVCIVEMAMNANLGVKTVTTTGYSIYPRNEKSIEALIDTVESNDKDFYRIETTSNYTINDPALYGYNGISQFSSTANVNVTNMMHSLGIQASSGGNRYYYNQNTAVLNMFLNLKYLIANDSYSGDLTYLTPLAEQGGVSIYQNNHHLPIAFAGESDVLNYDGESFIQFENQNELFKLVTGIDEDVFVKLDIKDVGHKGLNVMKAGYGNYNYQYNAPTDGSNDCYLKFNYNVMFDGPVYATFNFGESSNVKIKSGDEVLHSHNSGKYIEIFAAGDFNTGDVITLQSNVEEQKGGNGTVYAYQINSEVFEKGYQKLLTGALNVSEYDDTHIKGTISTENSGVIYTSIPFDGGWKAYIDGKEAEVKSIKNAFVAVPVSAGEHTVELKYSPPGFMEGAVITVVSIALLVALFFIEPKFRKKMELIKAEKTAQAERSAKDQEKIDSLVEAEKSNEEEKVNISVSEETAEQE